MISADREQQQEFPFRSLLCNVVDTSFGLIKQAPGCPAQTTRPDCLGTGSFGRGGLQDACVQVPWLSDDDVKARTTFWASDMPNLWAALISLITTNAPALIKCCGTVDGAGRAE